MATLVILTLFFCGTKPVMAADQPDLQTTSIGVTTLYAGAANTVTVNVGNNTTTATSGFSVRLEADGTTVSTITDLSILGNSDSSYWPLSVSFSWTPYTAAIYTLKAIVDTENTVSESDETNNEVTNNVTVLALNSVTVNVRVEGQSSTLWSGDVAFSTSTITDKQGDTYTIDHPTVLGALDAAADEGDFNYIVSSSYGTLSYIEEIGGESSSGYDGWLYTVNWDSADYAAVDYSLSDGDEIIWYYGGWSAKLLKLSVDQTTMTPADTLSAIVTAYNGADWDAVENATVYAGSHIYTTDASGQITGVSLTAGGYTLYAEKDNYEKYIRSNSCDVLVYVPLDIQSGWNFISFPRRLSTTCNTTETLFSDIDTAGHSIWGYNSEEGWQALTADNIISPLDGIWVYSAKAVILYPVFDPDPLSIPVTKDLSSGWNAIGYTDFTNSSANSALTSVENEWATLIGFDTATQSYEVSIINNAPDSDAHAETREVAPWKGYWLYMTDDGELAAISN